MRQNAQGRQSSWEWKTSLYRLHHRNSRSKGRANEIRIELLWIKNRRAYRVMSLAENFRFNKNASIAFDQPNTNLAKPKPLYKQKERTNRLKSRNVLSFFCSLNEIVATPRWNLRFTQMKSKALPWMKSNPSVISCEAGFHRESDFIHHRWISPVEDGFDCVILR